MTESLARLHEELALYLRKDLDAHNWLERRQIERRMKLLRQAIAREQEKQANAERS